MDTVQPAPASPLGDGAAAQSGRLQLPQCDDAVLRGRDPRNAEVGIGGFLSYVSTKPPGPRDSPPLEL
jgi:hypothetical protein